MSIWQKSSTQRPWGRGNPTLLLLLCALLLLLLILAVSFGSVQVPLGDTISFFLGNLSGLCILGC